MLVLGAQILLGFEFSGVFREGFENLPAHARYLDATALILMVITVALLITPESYHQIGKGLGYSRRELEAVRRPRGDLRSINRRV
jgi:hypothetical protein